ncbi:hypothetical protein HDU81_000651 [Chytriomyces hyalinus]|nr:hypothetical protein HDU81_000651 [Chytriomyces hyalinus]
MVLTPANAVTSRMKTAALNNQVRRSIRNRNIATTATMSQLSYFAKSVSVDGADFDTLQISTSGNGSTETVVQRGDGTQATFSVMARKADVSTNAPKVTFNQDQHRTLRLHIQYPDANKLHQHASLFNILPAVSSFLSKDPPREQVVQNTEVSITLPYELENLGVEGNVGSFRWDAGNVKSSFKVGLAMGNIETVSLLTCTDASLTANTGTIHVAELTASNSVELKSKAGEIKGTFKGYKSLDAETLVGSMDLTLHPHSPSSDTSLRCESGGVNAKVFGFHGKFNVETQWGGLRVSGHAGDGPFKSLGAVKFSGWVAKENVAGGNFGIRVGLGAANLALHP